MNRALPFLSLLVCCVAAPALAQGSASSVAAPVAKDKESEIFDDIERGLNFGVLGGPLFIVNPPASEGGKRPFTSGQMVQVELGLDIGERLTLSAFVMGSSNRAGSDYLGKSGGTASGDFSTLVPGASLRGRLVGFADDQGAQRTWIYARVGAGYAMFSPRQLLPDSDILVFAGPGLEYNTRLRHFSIGVEVTGTLLVASKSFGFALAPNVRYAF